MIVSIPDQCLQSSLRWSLGHGCGRSQPQRLQGRPRNGQLQFQRGFCNIVQDVIALWQFVTSGRVPEGVILRPAP